ncbi:hypothetical protein [Nocardia sp. NPDC051832]|uniref:hypothetical protein n=1 Tax=Nocardia sp. NPDC051832 TaxID=3155673 RepID=UPI00344181B8
MSDKLPQTTADLKNWMDNLTYDFDAPVPELPPPGAEGVLVKRSVKWSADLDQRLKAAADAKGMSQSELTLDESAGRPSCPERLT